MVEYRVHYVKDESPDLVLGVVVDSESLTGPAVGSVEALQLD